MICFILSVTLTDNRTGVEKRGEEKLKNGAVLSGAFPYTELQTLKGEIRPRNVKCLEIFVLHTS